MLHEIWLVWLLFVYLCKPWNRMKPSPSKISPYKYRTLTWRTKGVNPFVPGPISNRAFKRTAIYLICNEYSNSKYFMVLRSKMGFLRFTSKSPRRCGQEAILVSESNRRGGRDPFLLCQEERKEEETRDFCIYKIIGVISFVSVSTGA